MARWVGGSQDAPREVVVKASRAPLLAEAKGKRELEDML